MNKKTVAFICLGFSSVYGGNFIPSLIELGKKICDYNVMFVFTENAKNRVWVKEIKKCGFNVCFFESNKRAIYYAKSVSRLINNNNVVLVHFHFTNIRIPLLLNILNHKAKIVLHNHSDWSANMSKIKLFFNMVKMNIAYNFLGRRIIKIAVSKSIADKYHIIYVPNGIVRSRVKKYKKSELLPLLENIDGIMSNSTVNFIMFSWSPYVKGLDIAVNAIGSLNNKNARLLIVCGENNEREIREYIDNNCIIKSSSENLIFLPPIDDTYKYYSICDVFISASRSEGFPYCLMEAISVGKPSLMSNIQGTSWAKKYGAQDFINCDYNDCAKKMGEMIYSISEGKNVETNAGQLLDDLSIDEWTKKIINIYQL